MLDRIWAPWRAHYVSSAVRTPSSESSCFLCDALSRGDDREDLVAWRGPRAVVVLNRYPYNNGHLLVAPRVHVGSLLELDGSDLVEPIQTVRWMTSLLDRMIRPQGYNVGLNQGSAAGAGLPGHLHWHLVPRWDGDTNFMPILADAKVVTESLDAFYERLQREIAIDLNAGLQGSFINSSGIPSQPS